MNNKLRTEKTITASKLFLIIILLLPITLFSQIKITGKLIDSNDKAIELAEIIIFTKDSIAIKSEFSNDKGIFQMEEKSGSYILKIRKFGNTIYENDLIFEKNIDLGVIKVESFKKLEEVTVVSRKKLIERKIDRLIYNVESSMSSSSGDAIDVLKSTPSLIVTDNNISLVGKSSLNVMINDRLVQLTGEELSNYLKTLPSESISKIEVITTPPAKYDSEGNSGLVNIVLKKVRKDYFNGNIKTSFTQAKYSSKGIGGSLNYQKNKTSIISNVDYLKGISAPYQKYDIYYPSFNWNETYKTKNLRDNLSGRFVLDYEITPKTSMGIEYNKISNSSEITSSNSAKIINSSSKVLDSLIVTSSDKNIKRKTNSINFHLLSKLDTIGKSLTVDLDYFQFNTMTNNNFNTSTHLPSGEIKPNRLFFAETSGDQDIKIYSSKIDFVMPMSWVNLSFGGKLSFSSTINEILFFDIMSNEPVLDVSKSNHFNYEESNQSVYVSSIKKISDKWSVQLGLRYENTYLKGKSIELNQTNTNNYSKLFPSFYLSYTNQNQDTYTLNYSRRIERPSYFLLNPYKIYSTITNYTQGNPNLSPYYTNNIELSLVKGSFYHSIYFSYLEKGIDQITFTSPSTNYQYTYPYNFFTTSRIGISENYTFQKIKWWQSNNGLNVFYTNTNSSLSETYPNIKGFTGYFSSYNSFSLNQSKSLKSEINFVYQTSAVSNSYKTSPFYSFDLGFRYDFPNKKWQCSFNATDVFKTSGIVFTNNINNIRQEKFDYADNQKIRFSLIYKFGKSIKENRRNFSNEEEKKRTR